MMLHEAIYQLNETVKYIRGETAYDANGNEVQYDLSTVQALIEANTYKDQRAAAYPSIADQLDKLYHEGYDGWKAAIEAVKTQYPKPTE